MNSMNLTILEGNLTRDPELTYTTTGTAACRFSIGVNRSYKKGDNWEKEVSFFDVQTWAKLAEACSTHLKKGRGVRVQGRLKQDRWEKDGQNHTRVLVVADTVEFYPPKKEGNHGEDDGTGSAE